jgi:hypothetical protein
VNFVTFCFLLKRRGTKNKIQNRIIYVHTVDLTDKLKVPWSQGQGLTSLEQHDGDV